MKATIRNWGEFQHYKDRSPPWIKFHRSLLDNYDFHKLPVASRALAPMLWLLAAESNDGSVCVAPDFLAFRLRMPEAEVMDALNPLISAKFITLEQVASEALAERKQDARPDRGETEGEGEGEAERGGASAPAPKTRKRSDTTIAEWLATVEGDAIPADDPVFGYAAKVGIPANFLLLAWTEFEARHLESGKRYKDWRAAFRKCVRDNWYRLWWVDPKTGDYALTTAGVQAERAAA